MNPLAQRLVVRYHLSGMARAELHPYLKHRLELAGTQMDLFEEPAIEAIFQATNGLPRKVNLLAQLSEHDALRAEQSNIRTS